jgi:DNA modification methylase
MSEAREFPIPLATDADIAAFIARHGKPYDPETDDYQRTPFVADIREGKNDPIYNAHSYHTNVPPRAIIPYILHYTEPGDIILDPFCGSGMTGVAAILCADPPKDILDSVAGARKGNRRAILNDLSPGACHIAYNYCHPVDAVELKGAFDRIAKVLNDEFQWLYGTEHYKPALGLYESSKTEVACKLKNPPSSVAWPQWELVPEQERTWELIDRAEVERRLGAEVLKRLPLPEGVRHFVAIPATIQHTVWSDVYKCEGMVTTVEPTGKINSRTREPGLKRVRRSRGCGNPIVLWDVAVHESSGKVQEEFPCPHCGQQWKKIQLKRMATVPVLTAYKYTGLKREKKERGSIVGATFQASRRTSVREKELIATVEEQPIPWPFPEVEINTKGPQYNRNALSARKVRRLSDFYTKRNLRALAALWEKSTLARPEYRRALLFSMTSTFGRIERMTRYVFKRGGNCSLRGQLYFPSFPVEDNVLRQLKSKIQQVVKSLATFESHQSPPADLRISCSHAGKLAGIAGDSIDYIFTDPPFGSNIYYSEVNWLYECWLGCLTDRSPEAVVHRKNDRGTKDITDYMRLMAEAFREMYRVLKPGRFATIEFNNSDGQVFEAIKEAVRGAGFDIENMLFLDKEQKTFKQLKGEKGEEDVVGHDVIFNLRKPVPEYVRASEPAQRNRDDKLEHVVADAIREHLRSLPGRIKADLRTYSDEHRTTPFLNTRLMNSILKDVNVERINLPFIDGVCSRYFKRIDNRWYLPEEVVGVRSSNGLFDVEIKDETTALQWLHQLLCNSPLRIGDLRPHWMKATVKLTSDLSTRLERYLRENFWLDRATRRWRVPTDEESAQLHNLERQRACHDAERFLADKLHPRPADMEILGWIGHLYEGASFIEQEAVGLSDSGEENGLPEDSKNLYAMMPRLLRAVLKENVEPKAYAMAQRQCRLAAHKLEEQARREKSARPAPAQPGLFDALDEKE